MWEDKGLTLLRKGTKLRPLARPEESLVLLSRFGAAQQGGGVGAWGELVQQLGSCPSHGVPCIRRSQTLWVWGQ